MRATPNGARQTASDLADFSRERPHLLALAYRMLGDLGRAEELVQETWIRWSERADRAVVSPRGYLVTTLSRLCLTELGSARRVLEDARASRLPEPVDLASSGLSQLERREDVSMAFLVVLQRLTPQERAVLLLHDVFDLTHAEIAATMGRSEASSRKLLERARAAVADERRTLTVSREAHGRMVGAFIAAVTSGDVGALLGLLVEDAMLVTDGGSEGRRLSGITSLEGPLVGREKVAAFLSSSARRGLELLDVQAQQLNGQAAVVLRLRDGEVFAAVHLVTDGEAIHRIYFHGDSARLAHLARNSEP